MPSPVGSSFSTKAVSNTYVSLTDNTGYAVYGNCTGTPDTTAGIYQHGCLMVRSDTSTGANAVYQNTGSIAVPAWTLLSTPVADLLSSSPTAGIGYTTGAGGSVTQSANLKTSQVTLNTVAGVITTAGAALATTSASFTLQNSTIGANDSLSLAIKSGATAGAYLLQTDAVAAGSARISIHNRSGNSLSETLVINYQVVRGASS